MNLISQPVEENDTGHCHCRLHRADCLFPGLHHPAGVEPASYWRGCIPALCLRPDACLADGISFASINRPGSAGVLWWGQARPDKTLAELYRSLDTRSFISLVSLMMTGKKQTKYFMGFPVLGTTSHLLNLD
jgi:hypothetical protein